jgi:hypothetical protein
MKGAVRTGVGHDNPLLGGTNPDQMGVGAESLVGEIRH